MEAFYGLRCLSSAEMNNIKNVIDEKKWDVIEEIKFGKDEIIQPDLISSAGRLEYHSPGEFKEVTVIFSKSVPYDVMVEIFIRGDMHISNFADKLVEYENMIKNILDGVITEYDIACYSILCEPQELQRVENIIISNKELNGLFINELCKLENVLICKIDMRYPIFCIFSTSSDNASKFITTLEDIGRLKGAARHIISSMEKFNMQELSPVMKNALEYELIYPSKQLTFDIIQNMISLRKKILSLEKNFHQLNEENENIKNYKELYLRKIETNRFLPVKGFVNPITNLVRDIEEIYLYPSEIQIGNIRRKLQLLTKFISDIIGILSTALSIKISLTNKKINKSLLFITFLLFIISIIQIASILLSG